MRKRLSGVLIAIAFLIFATTAHAASDNVWDGMVKKLHRGVINTLTGWVEFPAQIVKGYNEGFRGDKDNKLIGVIAGIFDGIGHSAGRTLSGVADVAGFWAANPKDNEKVGIPLDAEYAWKEGKPYDLFEPDFTEAAVRPVVNKFFRGLSNGLLGFIELPKQIIKGTSQGALDRGVIKGLWYWCSRQISGLSDIVTAPLPNPEDTMGVPFDEEWPWETLPEKTEQVLSEEKAG